MMKLSKSRHLSKLIERVDAYLTGQQSAVWTSVTDDAALLTAGLALHLLLELLLCPVLRVEAQGLLLILRGSSVLSPNHLIPLALRRLYFLFLHHTLLLLSQFRRLSSLRQHFLSLHTLSGMRLRILHMGIISSRSFSTSLADLLGAHLTGVDAEIAIVEERSEPPRPSRAVSWIECTGETALHEFFKGHAGVFVVVVIVVVVDVEAVIFGVKGAAAIA